jgi:hypothetical protein
MKNKREWTSLKGPTIAEERRHSQNALTLVRLGGLFVSIRMRAAQISNHFISTPKSSSTEKVFTANERRQSTNEPSDAIERLLL